MHYACRAEAHASAPAATDDLAQYMGSPGIAFMYAGVQS